MARTEGRLAPTTRWDPQGSSHGGALASRLAALADLCDELTAAVEEHDVSRLVNVTERADQLAGEVRQLAGDLDPADRPDPASRDLVALSQRLSAASRRNAFLIEQAWALDAATMRLLLGLASGTGGPAPATEGTTGKLVHEYGRAPQTVVWFDRQA